MSRISVETEYDKAITAFARSYAMCYSAKCKGDGCKMCPTYKQQENVYQNMADADKLRVQYETALIIGMQNPPEVNELRATLGAIWDCKWLILLLLITIGLVFFVPAILYGDSVESDRIQIVLKETYYNLHDVNGDDKLNCIDYAIVFKNVWDKSYPSEECELVRNLSKDLNHLFVRIKKNGTWVCVEPSAYYYGYINRYTMKAFWEDKYDPRYNFYNETDYWMKHDTRFYTYKSSLR